jgi:hypothetical protein
VAIRLTLICACAQLGALPASAAGTCTPDTHDPAIATYSVRLFGGVIRVPVEYTLYADSALARGAGRSLELHDLTTFAKLASISIGNVADAGESLDDDPLLCTVGSLTVRQLVRSNTFATVIYDDKHYVTLLSSTDASAWKVLLRDFLGK